MQIVVNEQLKDAVEWTCKYANEYKVDIDIHIDADGEVSVSVCPTYRDRDTADTPQTEQRNRSTAEFITGTQIGDPQPLPNGITTWASSSDEPQTDCDTCRHKGVEGCEQPCLGCGCCGLYEAMTENDKLKEKVVEFIKSCARCKHRPIGAMMCEESCHYEPKTEPQTERSE